MQEIVKLASKPLPERPDGIVSIVKFTSSTIKSCVSTEGQYELLARKNPASLFLRSFAEYENSSILFAKAQVTAFPTYDIFYGGNRVSRVEGNNLIELQDIIDRYQLLNSELDLFSENANNQRRLDWGDGKIQSNVDATPRTTAAFIPGYDWDKEGGFFDETANDLQNDIDNYGDWVPSIQDK